MKCFLKIFIFLFVVFKAGLSFSQTESETDSLENLLASAGNDTLRIHILTELSKHYSRNRHDKAIAAAEKALAISENISYKRGMIVSHYYLALIHQYEGQYKEALKKFFTALHLTETLGADSLTIQIYNSIANNFSLQERRDEGLEYYNKALKMAREKGMKKFEATILGNMGNIYYYKSYDFQNETWDTAGLFLALDYYSEAVKLHGERNDSSEMISPLMNIALVQVELGKIQEALKILSELKIICEQMNDISNLIYINSNIAQAYLVSDNFSNAIKYFSEAIYLARTLNDRNAIMGIYAMISESYAEKKDYQSAYEYYLNYSQLRDSLITEENSRSVSEMQAKYDTEKKEKQIEMQTLELNKKQVIIYASFFGFLLMLSLAFVIFRGYKQKQKINEVITLQKEEVEKQKLIVEEKNQNITDSIFYAKRIQTAILPEQKIFLSLFPDSFIFYRPKDIVSGDFYWFSEKEESVLIAVADCTGHGVPGAMMSMVGSSLLHQIVNEKKISTPSGVLAELDKQIIRSLKQKGIEGESREGMDICFLEINKNKNMLKFSGANRPLFFLRDGALKFIAGSKNPIGSITRKEKIFDLHEIPLLEGDSIYMTTDGFTDQFGGATNKKFMTRRFKQTLSEIHHLPMQKQKEKLVTIIDDWKEKNEQVDDICVMGMKI